MKIVRYTSKSEVRLVFYSMCAVVPVFITRIGMKESSVPFYVFSISTLTSMAEKSAFFALFSTKMGRN